MGVLWHKLVRDLWEHKGRTAQVVLIISMGATAIGVILGTRNLVVPGMQAMWRGINPAMLNLFVFPPLSDDDLAAFRKEQGVKEIEGVSTATIEWRLNPEGEWRQGGLTARDDYHHMRLDKVELVQGGWPTEETMLIERDADTVLGVPVNGTVYLRVDGREYQVHTNGMIYNSRVQPIAFGGTAQFYITREFYDSMVIDQGYNQLLITAQEWDEAGVTELADRLQARLEKAGRQSGRWITDPNEHFFQPQMDGLFLLLGVLSALALALGLLLVYNTINSLIASQVDQVGIMKAIGARTGQILRLYILAVLAYGLLALLVSVPLGTLGAWLMTSWLVGSFGADLGGFDYSVQAVAVSGGVALFAPLLASLVPVISGARVTVREAISTYGLTARPGLVERLLAKSRFISRQTLLTISNTFRHKRRVLMLQVALVLSGLMFMMVFSVRDSVEYTIRDVMFAILNADVTMVFDQPQRISHLEELTLAYPEVKAVELWGLGSATIRPAGQPESEDDENIALFGVPLPTRLYGYQLRAGRWLEPEDSYAMVLNQDLADEVGVDVGDWVTVQYGEHRSRDWQVVGLVFDPLITTSANVPRDLLLRDLGQVGRAGSVWIQTETQDPASQIAIARGLRSYYERNHVAVSPQRGVFGGLGGDATTEVVTAFVNQFNFLLVLLGVMALIIGIVGSIALSGALSLSVLERRREIGVMRAIGASSGHVGSLFIGEGLILGWLSWLIALPLSLLAGAGMVQALGAAFQLELIYNFTPRGAVVWLVVITVLSIIASWLPARGAIRISVRESLAYQ